MTYLPGYGEFSQKIPDKHTVDSLDLLRESILYLEKIRYELWYCVKNPEIAKEIMSIDQDFMDFYDFSFEEYAIFKIGGAQGLVDPLVTFLANSDYVSKQQLTQFLEHVLSTEGGIKNAELLTVNKAIDLISKDIASSVEEEDDDPELGGGNMPEKTLEDFFEESESPEALDQQKEIDEFLNDLEKDPLPPVIYDAELPIAYANTLLQAANGIYKVFTEMVYSQNRYKTLVPEYTDYMSKQIKSYHPSSTTAYLDWIICQNFKKYRLPELQDRDLDTEAQHNNYHDIQLDILYNIFRTKLSLETDALPLHELKKGDDINFIHYEQKLDNDQKNFWHQHHEKAGQRIVDQFSIIPLYEVHMNPMINHYADTADEKIAQKGDGNLGG